MKLFGKLSQLTKIVFPVNSGTKEVELQAANQTNAGPVVVSIPDVGDAAGTLVEVDASQVLTNKTIDADLNTLSNIENADIKAGAAIDAAKIANGQVSNTEFQYLDGVTSSIQTQFANAATALSDHLADPTDAHDASAISSIPSGNLAATDVQGALNELQTDVDTRATSAALTAHTGASSGVHGVTGSVVGTSDTQNLTNKTLDDTSNALLKGGNTTGAPVRVGSNDAQSTVIEANNADRITARVASAADADVKLHGTAGVELPVGTAAQRPSSAVEGTIRFNSDADEFEGYANGAWASVGGGVNEQPLKNYLKTYALAAVSPGTLSTLASGTANLVSLTAFYADSTSGSAALTQSTSTALRGASNYLSALSGADTAGGRFFQFPAFALESTDLGKPVSISFDLTGLTATGWDVVVARYNSAGVFQTLIPVAGTASASTSTPSASLLTGTAQQRGFFVPTSTAGDLYALRFRRLSGAEQVRLDTLYVGPQPQLSGFAGTDLIAFSPTSSSGLGTLSAATAYWSRSGENMLLQVRFTTGTTAAAEARFDLPNGLTISSKLSALTMLGKWFRNSGATNDRKQGAIIGQSGNTYIRFSSDEYAIGLSPFAAQNGSTLFAPSEVVTLNAVIPIEAWSSNVTMADRAVEEYAFNTSTSTTTGDTTSFGNGASGAIIQAITANLRRRVRFQTAIQTTDRIVVDVSTDTAGRNWVEIATGISDNATFRISAFQRQNAIQYGIGNITIINSTDVDVGFGQYACENSSGGFAAAGEAWGTAGGARYWRVRKVSGGATVGFPVGARNVVGDTTGTVVPSGYIGEPLRATASATSVTTATITSVANITLTPGNWDVSLVCVLSGTTLTSNGEFWISTALNGNGAVKVLGDNYVVCPTASNVSTGSVPSYRINVTSTTTYYLNVFATGTVITASGRISAVRIA